MSQQSTDTDADTASVLSASSAASYERRKKAKEAPNSHDLQELMSATDYSDYSRYPKFSTKPVEREGPGIRMRETRRYDDNALPAGYHPVTKNTTGGEGEPRHRRPHHRRSSSSASPRIRQEVRAVPHPAAPGGVMPHVVTHIDLSPPRRHRRHRSASREPPPTTSRPAYVRRRSMSYDDGHRSRTRIINLPPPPVVPNNPGHIYGAKQPLPPLQPLPASPEFGYGAPAGAPGAYAGTPPFVPPRPTNFSGAQPPALGLSPAMTAGAAGSPYPPSRRSAFSNAHSPPATSLSPYGGSPRTGMGQYSPYSGGSSTVPNIGVVSPTAPSAPMPANVYGGAPASQVYSPQTGYGTTMGSTTAPVVINVPPAGGTIAQQPIITGSRRTRAASMGGIGYGTTGMGTGANPYGSLATAPGAGIGNLFGGAGNYPAPQVGGAFGRRRHRSGSLQGGVYDESNPYGAGNIGYGQSANGVYGFGPGQARDPTPGGTAPSPPPSQMPPGTGFFGGLFRRSPKSDALNNHDRYAQGQNHGRPRWRAHHN